MTLELVVVAIGVAFIIEGLVPALFPNKWRNYVLKLAKESPSSIRSIGITVVIIGAIIVWSQG